MVVGSMHRTIRFCTLLALLCLALGQARAGTLNMQTAWVLKHLELNLLMLLRIHNTRLYMLFLMKKMLK